MTASGQGITSVREHHRMVPMTVGSRSSKIESPHSTTPSSPNSISPRWSPSGSPPPTASRSRASSSVRLTSTPPRNTRSKFLIHGGPQGAWGDMWSYRWNAELFAANGYVVVMINPRGSTGYGQAFVDGVNDDWGGKPFTDLMTGLDYAEQHYRFIDKTRECALGASYGGYMADWILGHTNRFKCIVSHDGMFNAESAFGTTEEDWFNIWEFHGKPWDYYGTTRQRKPISENGRPRSPPRTSRRPHSSFIRNSTIASTSAKASSSSTPCSSSTSRARCSTSPTKATGYSSRRTRASGTRRSTTGSISGRSDWQLPHKRSEFIESFTSGSGAVLRRQLESPNIGARTTN